jgi:hypothetical protein
MSNNREKKYKDTKESAQSGIAERPEPPIDKPDPTEPVKISGPRNKREQTQVYNSSTSIYLF